MATSKYLAVSPTTKHIHTYECSVQLDTKWGLNRAVYLIIRVGMVLLQIEQCGSQYCGVLLSAPSLNSINTGSDDASEAFLCM